MASNAYLCVDRASWKISKGVVPGNNRSSVWYFMYLISPI